MSENRRNRRYSSYKDKSAKQIEDPPIQPKILLKAKDKETTLLSGNDSNIQFLNSNVAALQNKEHLSSSTATSTPTASSSVTSNISPSTSQPIESQFGQSVAQMTKPITILSLANNQVNSNTNKVLIKSNTDFLVVGVIGRQGIGKSTIMNFLASPKSGLDFADTSDSIAVNAEEIYKKFFKNREGVFPTKFKSGKSPSTPRTESLHMFITKDRLILLDGPPILSNPGKKDATTNEVEDINLIILLLTVCHLLIVVQDDYFDLNLVRLLQFAELCKPSDSDSKSFSSDHLPNILFLKNHAKYKDFLADAKLKYENLIKYCFKDSNLKIFFGQTGDNKKRSKFMENDTVNYFIFPEITENELYSSNLDILMDELRQRVFMNPRNNILNCEYNEALWFEIFSNSCMRKNEFYLSKYEEIRRAHTNPHTDQNAQN
ncbi:protein SMG9 [Condylostylus longicornis]|uniref:protein SMG9 n=1 Tax=Condylostylus longicornis TaxID=2530218 RepID=UPI00244E009E|nr:protein SMG9 [Condylostylus longicornis]